ncbi:kanadaptin [Gadus chalcogrammus]|uniref:kanadaptin n=1 Tax=Gadus chalcogrammus TaxID=1042646 RepID=UPI0024C3611B|nr:kanadaptin [Gadus chalcogrammus]
MADSSQSEVHENIAVQETHSAMETNEAMNTDNCVVKKLNLNQEEKEVDDTFKIPALFAAPSLAIKRGVTPSKPVLEPLVAEARPEKDKRKVEDEIPRGPSSSSINESTSPNTDQEDGDMASVQEKVVAPLKTKEAGPRIYPVNGPPAAKFKPHPPIPYTEPLWGGIASEIPYELEILKNGAILDTLPLTHSSYFVVGRLPVCDVSLEHPSISRYHAVLQFRSQSGEEGIEGEERGFYIHDLGSTHGTVVNKIKIPPKTYVRLHVGHVLKFGGSTRLFILQGPEFDEEEESKHTVTELKERSRKQRAELEKRMMGEGSDEEEDEDKDVKEGEMEGEGAGNKNLGKGKKGDSGCSWGMAEEAAPEEDEDEENPFATEFQEDQEAAYLKDPKKALQGFYDREGEELEFEYEDQNHGAWLCRIRLPVDDASGKQLVAEVTHTGKKKDAAIQCCLESCRILEARGVLRQEAVSRKRRKKNWEDEDYYGSDDDTFLDRTGAVEKKRKDRMKKAGKIAERPETYDSLVAKLAGVEKELSESLKKLNAGGKDTSGSSSEDPLDAFMSAVRSEAAMDAVERRKLHVHVADMRKEVQRLQKLVELTRPAQLPSLQPSSSDPLKAKKALPLFGAMKGGTKYKLKTGTIGKLPPKRANLPAELFNMKGGGVEEEEDEDDEEEERAVKLQEKMDSSKDGDGGSPAPAEPQAGSPARAVEDEQPASSLTSDEHRDEPRAEEKQRPSISPKMAPSSSPAPGEGGETAVQPSPKRSGRKKALGPSRPPVTGPYPEDDPDYCVWLPPTGQSGDGRTHLNEKFGY